VSSLVGHALGGMVAAKAAVGNIAPEQRRRFYLLMGLVSLIPDLDVVVFLLFKPLAMTPHRGASHSLLFAATTALVLTFLCARMFSFSRGRLFGCFLAAYGSHLALDYLMGRGPEIHFFWPFSEPGYLSPVQLVPTAFYGLSAGAIVDVLLSWATYVGISLELVIFVPLLYLPNARTRSQRTDLLMMTAAGIGATVALYN
jgi:membrane-bound metal-dependent hydrolase YbcI (DUF457 family)